VFLFVCVVRVVFIVFACVVYLYGVYLCVWCLCVCGVSVKVGCV